MKTGKLWKILTLIFIFMVVSTHSFSSVVGLSYFALAAIAVLTLSHLKREPLGQVERSILRIPVLYAMVAVSWLVFIASPFFAGQVFPIATLILLKLVSQESGLIFPLASRGPSDQLLIVRLIGDSGIALFGLTILAGFLLTYRKRYSDFKSLLPLAAAGAFIFIVGFAVYTIYTEATDLLQRAFIYVYFSAAPLSVFCIQSVTSLLRRKTHRTILCILLIALMATSAVYYNYPRFLYDNTSPTAVEDVRFPLTEWKSAGSFSLNHISESTTLWGDKIAFSFVGGYGDKEVYIFPKSQDRTLVEWLSTIVSRDTIIILRKSMITTPYLNYNVSQESWHTILGKSNIVYASGEVVMVAQP